MKDCFCVSAAYNGRDEVVEVVLTPSSSTRINRVEFDGVGNWTVFANCTGREDAMGMATNTLVAMRDVYTNDMAAGPSAAYESFLDGLVSSAWAGALEARD